MKGLEWTEELILGFLSTCLFSPVIVLILVGRYKKETYRYFYLRKQTQYIAPNTQSTSVPKSQPSKSLTFDYLLPTKLKRTTTLSYNT